MELLDVVRHVERTRLRISALHFGIAIAVGQSVQFLIILGYNLKVISRHVVHNSFGIDDAEGLICRILEGHDNLVFLGHLILHSPILIHEDIQTTLLGSLDGRDGSSLTVHCHREAVGGEQQTGLATGLHQCWKVGVVRERNLQGLHVILGSGHGLVVLKLDVVKVVFVGNG